jgi:succinate dehydrogenase / fumarate reductase, cytochrome b subunit
MSTPVASEAVEHGASTAAPYAPKLSSASFLTRHIRKVLAASGLVMAGFVVLHLAGNLVAFAGPAVFNGYARGLRELGSPVLPEGGLLWLARAVLAAALMLHLVSHMYVMLHPEVPSPLTFSDVRPPWYATLPLGVLQSSGALIALFVGLHLAQLTLGAIHPAFVPGDAYQNTIVVLRSWPASAAYIGAALAVGIHLLPGLWTAARSLGLIRPRTAGVAGNLVPAIALGVVVGMSAVPIAVVTGVLR